MKAEFGGQQANDNLDRQLIRQRHVVDAQADRKRLVKPVGSGYGHLVTKQNYAVLSSRPFVAFNSPRDTLDEHAEMLEGATQGMWKLSGAVLAWLMSVQDVVEVGRGVLWVCHVPQLWRGLDFQQKESESGKEYLDRVDNLKLANWPIVARHVDVRDCWPTFTLKREVDQVVKLGKITVRQAKAAYGLSSEKKDTEKLDVIEYADWTHTVTVLGGKTEAEFAKEPFEHNMGMNPFIFLEAPPVSENDEGIVWEGAVANLRHLIPPSSCSSVRSSAPPPRASSRRGGTACAARSPAGIPRTRTRGRCHRRSASSPTRRVVRAPPCPTSAAP